MTAAAHIKVIRRRVITFLRLGQIAAGQDRKAPNGARRIWKLRLPKTETISPIPKTLRIYNHLRVTPPEH
jgi:hypothetical protein